MDPRHLHDSSGLDAPTSHLSTHTSNYVHDDDDDDDDGHVGHGHDHSYTLDPMLDEITTAEIISASIRANVAAQEAEERARADAEAHRHGLHGVTSGMSGIGGGEHQGKNPFDIESDMMAHAHGQLGESSHMASMADMPTMSGLLDVDHQVGVAGPSAGNGDIDAGMTSTAELTEAQQATNETLAMYGRPIRDHLTPHPEEMEFATRSEFETWLEGELAWCHYIQRRITNPQKRAEERARARDREWANTYASESLQSC